MSSSEPVPPAVMAGGRLPVMDAVGLGWRLLKSDFWTLWLVSLLVLAIQGFAGPAAIVVGPPMVAGMFYVLSRRAEGGQVEVGMVFEGFSHRFKQSFFAYLLPFGIGFGAVLVWVPIHLATVFGAIGAGASGSDKAAAGALVAAIALDVVAYVVLVLGAAVVWLFFIFAQCAVWDRPDSGWEAAKESARLVWRNFWSVVGLLLLFWAISLAGSLLGMAACCIGIWFTMPIVMLWWHATVLYLYRSWSGRPGPWRVEAAPPAVVGPAAPGVGFVPPGVSPPPAEGPIPPTDVGP